ncbi:MULTISPECIES: flagellar biosynthesis anti-sigma factor FlgM [Kosakonia]|uniref:Negative regulator of flagellin synthesis n=1 Tax=Kosakonia quasisacchari TaxID=2529380 RepID=A0A4R0HP36_9ENTR|nr:flagellar biosynthesis anti-sigma factor FlgM [Kosakonia quasisacchari]TCC09529.1 flagellar biosynthesis anti-sigma factor FlgM [Kosakonia quasisacchari]
MNIERTRQANPIQATGTQQQPVETRVMNDESAQSGKTDAQQAGTQVKLSQLTQQIKNDGSRDVNTERLAAIKAKMDAGELHLDSDKIASALVRDIFRFS